MSGPTCGALAVTTGTPCRSRAGVRELRTESGLVVNLCARHRGTLDGTLLPRRRGLGRSSVFLVDGRTLVPVGLFAVGVAPAPLSTEGAS